MTGQGLDTASVLRDWFSHNKRPLVFRRDKNPYFVWVSEIMAQQTRISAVTPYFERFIAAFPTVKRLAKASQEDVLRLWAGLGYYSRARNLHKAAQMIAAAGSFPREYEAIRALPGVGDYTAGAIASIAFGHKTPAVDGNVLRVFARVAGRDEPVTALKNDSRSWLLALMENGHAGEITEAVMELGALICAPQNPRCLTCPISRGCAAFRDGRQGELPVIPPKNAPKEVLREVWLIFNTAGDILVRRRTERLLHGMYEFPSQKLFDAPAVSCGQATHIFTHLRWLMEGFVQIVNKEPAPKDYFWTPVSSLDTLPFPAAMAYFLKKAKAGPPPPPAP